VPDERNLDLIRDICRYLDEPHETAPTLEELADRFHLSPYHLQRTFKRIVGITPRQYAAAHRLERFKDELRDGKTVTDALYDAGYQSSSSAYEESLGMSPRSYQQGGSGMQIAYTAVPCPLGWLLVAATDKGLCAVRLGDSEPELEDTLASEFPGARLVRNDPRFEQWVSALLAYLSGSLPHLDLPLDVQATAFQRRVWDALQTIPYGMTRSYQDVADSIGQPEAVRAVAHACATNPVALVIPCHRVVRKDGSLGGYRWGLDRKRALLTQEAAANAHGQMGDGI
jgi:AraC family transcriptional regulator of adaptative response/methylated-DNA-[protein]-cysteine methyltransferase